MIRSDPAPAGRRAVTLTPGSARSVEWKRKSQRGRPSASRFSRRLRPPRPLRFAGTRATSNRNRIESAVRPGRPRSRTSFCCALLGPLITTRTRRSPVRITMHQRRPRRLADDPVSSVSRARSGGDVRSPAAAGLMRRGRPSKRLAPAFWGTEPIDGDLAYASPPASSFPPEHKRPGTRSARLGSSDRPPRPGRPTPWIIPPWESPADGRGPFPFGKIEIRRDGRTRKDASSATTPGTTPVTPARAPFFP